ncbi:RNA polymerase sigma factor [Tindallia californiensis]|uniref:RNA polymerase sigma factor n=1 Tax=Tindallia californiensis TaxID=159292 RepID=A0A1H3L8X3_9FIRM|nr:sigma-70 family RNA polymerase sigma factor [Tindallia californiensis]SDY60384.1 RNA polymerase sigma-70 factor, ECF subfamily [Tindallia californiensis]
MTLKDDQIVKKILQGETVFFEELVSRYRKPVFSICYRMVRQREESEDLAQEVFVKAYRHLKQYNPERKFSSWILKIATNTTIDALRKKRLETIPLEEEIETHREDASAEKTFLQQEASQEIETAIDRLPQEYRIVVLLYHQQGKSYQDIAEILDIPLSMVKNRLFRARKILKTELKKLKEEMIWTTNHSTKTP